VTTNNIWVVRRVIVVFKKLVILLQDSGAGTAGAATLDSLMSKAKAIDIGYFEATSDIQGNITEGKYWKKGDMVKIGLLPASLPGG